MPPRTATGADRRAAPERPRDAAPRPRPDRPGTGEHTRPLDVEALARDAGVPPGRLSRQFRDAWGQPSHACLMTCRIERAMALLRHGGISPAEVCRAVGGPSTAAFDTRFTEPVGMAPGVYRSRAARTRRACRGT